ncbi:FlgD immunoglobulin-like domain containing protein [Treponema socranskii]|uniref:FlgD immunoglobulin-like domain containing protein n=1 Tax=Treponema socranskii TaxID=53419 RepID=UPI003D8E0262
MKRISVLIAAVLFLFSAVSAFAQRQPKYISPNNDGVQDSLDVPLRISDRRYVVSWSFVVENAGGSVVRTIGNKLAFTEKLTFKSFWKQLFSPKKTIDIPSVVSWNGVMDNGETAPDGTYYYYFTAADDNGNVGKTDKYTVVVDTTPPSITLTQPTDKIFGEGAKASFTVRQSGSKEDEWKGIFAGTDGTAVKNYSWKDMAPPEFNWNGTDDSDKPVADGVYSYTVTATDRAGNTSPAASISNIIFSAEKPATNIAISGSRYFSPNTASKQNVLTFNVTIPVPEASTGNKLTEWAVTVVDANGKVCRTFDQSTSVLPPETIVFDGTGADGKTLPDGRYRARVTAKYLNGYETTPIVSPVCIIDTKQPEAQLRVSDKVFGAGSKSTITINETIVPKTLAAVPAWTGRIYASSDMTKAVREYSLGEFPPETISWDGLDDGGKFVPDGSYVYELSAIDLAGNGVAVRSDAFSFDTTKATLLLAMQGTAFSPNGDKVKDTISFTPVTHAGSGGIVKYVFKITAAGSSVALKTVSENKSVPASFVWDGRDDKGALCSDGQYIASLEITSANASTASASTQAFALDTKSPYLAAEIPWTSFSPSGDSIQIELPVGVRDCTTEKLWTAEVRNARGTLVRKYTWAGTVQTDGKAGFSWNGADESGNTVPDGTYSLVIASTDEAGNAFSTALNGIAIDTRDVKAYVTTTYDGISPNGDGVLDSQRFDIRTSVSDTISSWNFDVCREDGKAVRSRSSKDGESLPESIAWDGFDDAGKAGEGTFTGKLRIAYRNGRSVSVSSSPFVCSATPPELSVRTTPAYFSPDNDGVDDDLFIKLNGSTKGKITEWSFAIDDPNGRRFWQTGGTSAITERIVWDGLSNTQKTASGAAERVQSAVDYPWTFTVKDNLGMTSTVKGIIPVDVLVIRDGNVLKMAVPSIIFRPDNADFKVESVPGKRDGVTAEQAANNERILKRIAEILNKFKEYKVTVVGHANRTTENEAEETQDNPRLWGPALIPLSEKRAEFVKSYLVDKGISASRLATQGKGGTELVVDWRDKDHNWKNRRVEFILQK